MPYVAIACRWILGSVFLAAGLAKAGRPSELAAAMQRYGLLPRPAVRPLAWGLPAFELLLGASLVAGAVPLVAASLAGVALTVFGSAIAVNLRRGRRFECGCGFMDGAEISWMMVLRNGSLLIVALFVVFAPKSGLSVAPGPTVFSSGHVPSASRLIAMPLLAILIVAAVRLALSSSWLFTRPSSTPTHERTHEGDSSAQGSPHLPITVVDAAANSTGVVRMVKS